MRAPTTWAILFANATLTTMGGLRAIIRPSQESDATTSPARNSASADNEEPAQCAFTHLGRVPQPLFAAI